MGYYEKRWEFTLDSSRGFGILFDPDSRRKFRKVFYENGKVVSGEGVEDFSSPVSRLREYASTKRSYGYSGPTKTEQKAFETLMEHGDCSFAPGKTGAMYVHLETRAEKVRIQVKKPEGRWYFDASCSCGKSRCAHVRAAAEFLGRRLDALQHSYVTTDQAVDKSVFLEPALESAVSHLNTSEGKQEEIRQVISDDDGSVTSASLEDIAFVLD